MILSFLANNMCAINNYRGSPIPYIYIHDIKEGFILIQMKDISILVFFAFVFVIDNSIFDSHIS